MAVRLMGSHGLAGEIGHLQLDPTGPPCGCGGRGCLEMVASGTALSRRYAITTGRLLPAEAVLDLVIDGDPVATASGRMRYRRWRWHWRRRLRCSTSTS